MRTFVVRLTMITRGWWVISHGREKLVGPEPSTSFLICQVVLKFCTEHDNDSSILYTKFKISKRSDNWKGCYHKYRQTKVPKIWVEDEFRTDILNCSTALADESGGSLAWQRATIFQLLPASHGLGIAVNAKSSGLLASGSVIPFAPYHIN